MKEIITDIKLKVQEKFLGEGSGHDWWHIYRVWQLAKQIAEKENADLFVVELAALLHDIADWKFNNGDDKAGATKARKMLDLYQIDEEIKDKVCKIIEKVSFKGAGMKDCMKSLEGKIVQDADRLDAIGAIGIARTFAYGGFAGQEMYDPNLQVEHHATFEDYKNTKSTSINHFYEKLLLLKDRMHTQTAKEIATERHSYMESFLTTFFNEWETKIS